MPILGSGCFPVDSLQSELQYVTRRAFTRMEAPSEPLRYLSPERCPSCGARDYLLKGGKYVCAYCGQDAT